MPNQIRFGDYLREVTVHASKISYRHLMPKPRTDAQGRELPYQAPKLTLRPLDAYRLLQPYVSTRFLEQARAVIPLAIYLGLFQWFVLKQSVADASVIGVGLLAVMLGLMLFMEGLKLGLMPFGEVIGNTLPRKVGLPLVLTIAFILGVGVTFAEPAIGALQVAGSIVDPKKAPYLYTLLTDRAGATVLVVGIGVGLAAVLGTMRFIYGWSLKPLIYWSLAPTLAVSAYAHFQPELAKIVGLAWDCGGVTTGPVTVPLVLALGIGVASAVGKGGSSLSGFGIVTLASVFPILGVLLLGIYVSLTVSPAEIIAAAAAASATPAAPGWHETTPGVEIVMGLRAIVPLVLFLVFVLFAVLRERMANAGIIRYGIVLAVAGMILFNLGLTYGLAKLGDQSGGLVPGAFTRIDAITDSPLYRYGLGVFIAGLFAWLLGFGATLAEPALNALGITVENLTNGAFRKPLLMYAVSLGVAAGIAIGVLKIIFGFPLLYVILPGYAVAVLLTVFSTEEFVNVAWDSAGVTTGPVTVPLVLAMGLGFGKAVGATEGFGILAAASVCPIISVLAFGLYAQRQARLRNEQERDEAREQEVLVA
jgi:hypothetical protein